MFKDQDGFTQLIAVPYFFIFNLEKMLLEHQWIRFCGAAPFLVLERFQLSIHRNS
ncbi:MAG: hypothetical protein FD168_1215 [Desulfobulbaceae bacterium]|jgi:hypothetical protein|nr:MAG: hypothetical protein FD168_1215 [Desulfobulbaceae bacterium]